jgi:Homeodomain-like domain
MGNKTNDELAILQRRKQAVELSLQGWSQPAIAQHLQVSQPTICADLKAVRREWRESAIRDFDELRDTELQKLDLIEREAWGAWQRSQKPAQSAVVIGEGMEQKARKSLKHQYGDPRFLQLVSQCIGQRRSLLGLDVLPPLAQPENSIDANLSLEARRERVLSLVAAISEQERLGQAGATTLHE